MGATQPSLETIDAKLGALLALAVEWKLNESSPRKGLSRSLDRLLTDAGISTRETSKLLGKTERAVQLQLQKERERRSKGDTRESDT
jgi:hypothetical protein